MIIDTRICDCCLITIRVFIEADESASTGRRPVVRPKASTSHDHRKHLVVIRRHDSVSLRERAGPAIAGMKRSWRGRNVNRSGSVTG